MLKMILWLYFEISFLIVNSNECFNINVQTEILKSLTFDLSIKNIIIINPIKSKDGLTLAKYSSQLNIYISFLSVLEMNRRLLKYNTEVMYFIKSVVFINDENILNDMPKIFTKENEYAVSKFIWISFNKDLLKETKYYIPYSTQLLIMENFIDCYRISEIYYHSIDSQMPFERPFGIWRKESGLSIYEKDLYQKRFNMNKTVITLVYQRGDKRFTWLEFITIIVRMMNFRVHIRNAKDYEKGATYKGKLLIPEVILTPTVFDYTSDYYPFVFGLLWKLQAFLYIKYDLTYEDRGIPLYLRPFSIRLWHLLSTSIIISTVCTLIMTVIKRKLKNYKEISLINAFYHSIEAFTNQYGGEKPITFSIRIVMITMRLIALFIVPAYSAAILTFILVPNIKTPFNDIKGFVQDGSYKLGFSIHDQYNLWFKYTNDPWSKMAYESLLMNPNEMPKNYWEEFQMLCENNKVAFIFFGDLAVAAPCRVIKIPTPLTTVWNGLYLRENSPYTKIFNRILKTILSSGVFNKNVREIPMFVEEYKREAITEEKTVTIEKIAPILKLIGILYSIAGLLFILELALRRIIFKCRRRS